jgi:hypothetical protein
MSAAKTPTRDGDEKAVGGEILLPNWVPEEARQRLNKLRKTPLGQDKRGSGLLQRLASYEAMKTEVWKKLPSEPQGFEGTIIEWAFSAYTIFRALRRPFPKTKAKQREWAKHREKLGPVTDPAYLSQLSNWLSVEIQESKLETDLYWTRFWEGDKAINVDHVLTTLDQLRAFYARMDNEYRELLATLPGVNRWNAKAAQKFFTEFLSSCMKETYGQPLDAIVAALAEVAFDLPQGLAAETVRGRRRIGSGPENSKRKSR